MELKDYVRALRARWRSVVAIVVFCVVVAGGVSYAITPQYEATSQLFVSPATATTANDLVQSATFMQAQVKSYIYLVDSAVVLQPVIDKLGLDMTVEELASQVVATAPTDTVLLDITVTNPSAGQAASIANAVTAEFIKVATDLQPTLASKSPAVKITVVQPAARPQQPVSPNKKLYIGLGFVIGLALGFGWAVTRQLLNKQIRREADVKQVADVAVIGHVPFDKAVSSHPLITDGAALIARSEAIRQVRTNLQFLDVPGGHRSYVITSSVAGEGKSLTAVNVAIAVAETGLSVCFVEADLRRPTAGRYFGLRPGAGLSDVLVGRAQLQGTLQRWGAHSLDVLPSGTIPPNPSELLAGKAMGVVLSNLESSYDVVIVDSPPLLPVTDAIILGKRCAGVIVVIASDKKAITKDEFSRALEGLGNVGARLLGVVLNRTASTGVHAYSTASTHYESAEQADASAGHDVNAGVDLNRVAPAETVRPGTTSTSVLSADANKVDNSTPQNDLVAPFVAGRDDREAQ